jgi:hypothetical protein
MSVLRLGAMLALIASTACARRELDRASLPEARRARASDAKAVSFDMASADAADAASGPLEVCVDRRGAVRCLAAPVSLRSGGTEPP